MAGSIGGIASGLDTATIINQLMQLEALPQSRLKSQQGTEKSRLTAYRALNTDTSMLGSKAESLAKASTWQTAKGTVSGAGAAGVTVKVGAAATPGQLSFTVDKVAARHQLAFTDSAALSDVVAGATVKLTDHDGTVHDLATGGGTLTEVVAAINASTKDTGVTATAVKVSDNSYRLLVQSAATGADTSFTLTKGDGTDLLSGASVTAGSDAQITLGGGITATSTSNTFTGIVPGVDVTLDPAATLGSSATVTVAQDSTDVVASVKEMVKSLNSLLSSIDTQTAGKTGTTSAGVLAGDSTARALRSTLVNTIFGYDGKTTMADIGIQTDKFGSIVFDETKLKDALAKDPAAVAARFTTGATKETDGWAARLFKATEAATDRKEGTLTAAISGRDAEITRLTKNIEAWDSRLDLRRTTLERQYSALEVALSGIQSQGNWLSGQLAGLSSSSS